MYNYHNKKFRSIQNSGTGEVSGDTVFHYYQEGHVFWATYKGGAIVKGYMVGKVAEDGTLDFNYQHINRDHQLMTGFCTSTPRVLDDGRIELSESWEWTSGQKGKGESTVVEIANGTSKSS